MVHNELLMYNYKTIVIKCYVANNWLAVWVEYSINELLTQQCTVHILVNNNSVNIDDNSEDDVNNNNNNNNNNNIDNDNDDDDSASEDAVKRHLSKVLQVHQSLNDNLGKYRSKLCQKGSVHRKKVCK